MAQEPKNLIIEKLNLLNAKLDLIVNMLITNPERERVIQALKEKNKW